MQGLQTCALRLLRVVETTAPEWGHHSPENETLARAFSECQAHVNRLECPMSSRFVNYTGDGMPQWVLEVYLLRPPRAPNVYACLFSSSN